MVDAIEIIINNGAIPQVSAFIYYKEKVCYLNDKKYSVDDEFLNEFTRIISGWKNEYGTKEGIDVEEFTITVHHNGKEYVYHGKGVFPKYYSRIKELLGDLNVR